MARPQYTPALPIETLIPYIDASGDCWEWISHISHQGYGDLCIQIEGKWRYRHAHRLVWTALCGPIPDNLTLDHLCRIRRCVNPDHLEPVPNRINVLRGYGITAMLARRDRCNRGHQAWEMVLWSKGRTERLCRLCHPAFKLKRYCLRGHERTPENIKGKGNSGCRKCHNFRERERYRAAKVAVGAHLD